MAYALDTGWHLIANIRESLYNAGRGEEEISPMARRQFAEQLFDGNGERVPVGPVEHLDVRGFFEENPELELTENFHDLLPGGSPVTHRGQIIRGFQDLRMPASRTELEHILQQAREMEPWMFADILRQELETTHGSLVGNGHFNLFWIPAAVVVYRDVDDTKWHIDVADARRFGKFDRVFF
jgi:hypothetical protein